MDRNSTELANIRACTLSLSARRAWIEIFLYAPLCCFCCVALRKESVDRNTFRAQGAGSERGSLSARRAWIEIAPNLQVYRAALIVALRKESVDRNHDGAGGVTIAAVALRKESVDRNG